MTKKIFNVAHGSKVYGKLFSTNEETTDVHECRLVRRDEPKVVASWEKPQIHAGVGPENHRAEDVWYRFEIVVALQPEEESHLIVHVVSPGVIQSRECVMKGGGIGGVVAEQVEIYMRKAQGGA